jgi:rhodanese-related sulfurtransferase
MDPRTNCNFYLRHNQVVGFFIIEVVTVYCVVGTESYKPGYVLSLKGYIKRILSSGAIRWKQANGARVFLVIICYDCIQ